MRDRIRAHAPILITAVLVAALTTGGPALAGAAFDAMNAHKVDGKHAVGATASADQRAGKLVATGATGFLPNGIIKKANNADKLDGVDSIAFARLPQFASVDAAGSTFLARGVTTSVRDSTGVYHVLFDTPVDRCGHVATSIQGAQIVQTVAGGRFTTGPNASRTVRVYVYTHAGSLVNGAFTLAMVC